MTKLDQQRTESYCDEDLECGQKPSGRRHGNSSQSPPWFLYLAIVMAGSSLASILLYFGISNAREEISRQLILDGTELTNMFESLWNEYKMAALLALQVGEGSNLFERFDFYELHRNLEFLGLEYSAMAYCIRLDHDDRQDFEQKAGEYYTEIGLPSYPGLLSVMVENATISVEKSPEKPYYNPCPYMVVDDERYQFLASADMLTATDWVINKDVRPGQAILSRVLSVPDFDTKRPSRFVTMGQPRRDTTFSNNITNFSFLTVKPDCLLQRLVSSLPRQKNAHAMSIYLFDTSPRENYNTVSLVGIINEGYNTYFVGGVKPVPRSTLDEQDGVEILDETDLETVLSRNYGYKFEKAIRIADRVWTMIVFLDDDNVDMQMGYVAFAAGMILLVSCGLSCWLKTSHTRRIKLDEIQRANEAEKAALEVQNAEKKAANERELNDFMAHEVRNPLSAALSACSFVSSSLDDTIAIQTEKGRQLAKDDLGIVDSSLHFINDLLRNMLDLHRAGAHQLKLTETPTSVLDDVLKPSVGMLYCRGLSVSVTVDCPADLTVSADRIRLKQIVLNLARNSVKFVVKGFIRIRARVDSTNGGVVIDIEDSGPGIPENKRHKLFQKFQESLDSLHQGTGIGLAVCRKLIDLMGGDIILDHEYDSGIDGCPGARFSIVLNRLPLAIEPVECDKVVPSFQRKEHVVEDCIPETCSVLFVDDDTLLRRLFSRSLSKVKPKWTIQEAANGETALELATKVHYDVIFMDQYMASVEKQMLGTETVHALRSRGVTSLVCGLSANDLADTFLEAGANAFLMKPLPCKPDAMMNTLRYVFQSEGQDVPFLESDAGTEVETDDSEQINA